MPYFYSRRSKQHLQTCRIELADVFEEAILIIDHTILCGHRPEAEQTAVHESGASEKEWPDGSHNKEPSDAVDASPYPIPTDWGRLPPIPDPGGPDLEAWHIKLKHQVKELHRFYHFAGIIIGIGQTRGIKIRWGGDWDSDHTFNDQTFDDLVHFELVRG